MITYRSLDSQVFMASDTPIRGTASTACKTPARASGTGPPEQDTTLFDNITALYNDAGWTNYTSNLVSFQRALQDSLYLLTAWDGDALVGLLRAVGDRETVLYIQDILVLKAYQRQGIGRALLEQCVKRHKHIRQKILLTDNTEKTLAFYQACGFQRASEHNCIACIRLELF